MLNMTKPRVSYNVLHSDLINFKHVKRAHISQLYSSNAINIKVMVDTPQFEQCHH